MIDAVSATNAVSWIVGRFPSNSNNGMLVSRLHLVASSSGPAYDARSIPFWCLWGMATHGALHSVTLRGPQIPLAHRRRSYERPRRRHRPPGDRIRSIRRRRRFRQGCRAHAEEARTVADRIRRLVSAMFEHPAEVTDVWDRRCQRRARVRDELMPRERVRVGDHVDLD